MGGPAEEEVKRQIAYIEKFVEEHAASGSVEAL
jgi:hypothetical protein